MCDYGHCYPLYISQLGLVIEDSPVARVRKRKERIVRPLLGYHGLGFSPTVSNIIYMFIIYNLSSRKRA